MNFDGFSIIWKSIPFLVVGLFPNGQLGGLALTLVLSVTIGAASLVLGALFGMSAALAPSAIRWAVRSIMTIVRGVPALAFLFWVYFLVPRLTGLNLSPIVSAGIALTIYHGAYMGEDIRGGLHAIPRGQWEAARCSGLGTLTTLLHVILPQSLRAVTPSLVGRMVNLIIYTSVVSILGILEFTRAAVLVNNREILYSQYIFAFVGLVYFGICYSISVFGRRLEARWDWASVEGRRARSGGTFLAKGSSSTNPGGNSNEN